MDWHGGGRNWGPLENVLIIQSVIHEIIMMPTVVDIDEMKILTRMPRLTAVNQGVRAPCLLSRKALGRTQGRCALSVTS